MTEPPKYVVDLALAEAIQSPCQKSKRGVAAFVVIRPSGFQTNPSIHVVASAYNGAPDGSCDGSEACRRDCAKRCAHAEQRAIRLALFAGAFAPAHMQLVHVKVVDGEIVAGGGPSCWQCSRDILDAGFAGIWLFEHDDRHPASAALHGKGAWRYYDAQTFHRITSEACGIGGPR